MPSVMPYYALPDKQVLDSERTVKFIKPLDADTIRILPYGRIIHWSMIENCYRATPQFYVVYPYNKTNTIVVKGSGWRTGELVHRDGTLSMYFEHIGEIPVMEIALETLEGILHLHRKL